VTDELDTFNSQISRDEELLDKMRMERAQQESKMPKDSGREIQRKPNHWLQNERDIAPPFRSLALLGCI
jgi:hypothetical protein